jgi:hypothetical protein
VTVPITAHHDAKVWFRSAKLREGAVFTIAFLNEENTRSVPRDFRIRKTSV